MPLARDVRIYVAMDALMLTRIQTWERESPEALQEGRIDFVPLDFLNEAPVAGMDVYYVGSTLTFERRS